MMFRFTSGSVARWSARALAGVVLVISTIALPACQPSIEIRQPDFFSPPPIATVAPAAHSIAIIGVDFDPPLDYAQIISNGGLTLLVAIENRGFLAETKVEVSARLLDPDPAQASAVLLDDTVIVRSLAPGELRVVRFSQVNALPVRERYELVVQVGAVAGEVELEDNVRTYDILVHDVAR